MSNTKNLHTPGPWQVMPEEVDRPYIRVRGTELGSRYKVANVPTPVYDGVDAREARETRANARLIAAAPELLEALRQCAEVLEHTAGSATGYCCCGDRMDTHADPMSSGHIPVDEGLYHAQRVADVARAAIAKAT